MVTTTIFPISNNGTITTTSGDTIARCSHCGEEVKLGRTLCNVCRQVPYTIVQQPVDAIGKEYPNMYPLGPTWPNYPQITFGPGDDMPTCNGKPVTSIKELPGYKGDKHASDHVYGPCHHIPGTPTYRRTPPDEFKELPGYRGHSADFRYGKDHQ